MTHEQQEAHAEAYRLAQAAMLLRMFRQAHGREARTMHELRQWGATLPGRPLRPDDEDFEEARRHL